MSKCAVSIFSTGVNMCHMDSPELPPNRCVPLFGRKRKQPEVLMALDSCPCVPIRLGGHCRELLLET